MSHILEMSLPVDNVDFDKAQGAYWGAWYVEIVGFDANFGQFVVERLSKRYNVSPSDLRPA